ncbi:MAG: amino acid permease [Candidatus Omnitrophica bacterium]|nr:amino acid permease [Candidatus Omnitrophota bacterium]
MSIKRFGTFEGVFTPTFLSILGVIMYLRLGWVVGVSGLKNALIIIAISNLITFFTCLSVSSIATNMRIGTGGAYAIISKSLGLQAGGAIGIPLYLSQAISVTFYITGFSECWISVFPRHAFIAVSIITWLILLAIAYSSAKFAFRLQYAIIAIILFSLVSFFLGKSSLAQPALFRKGTGAIPFWGVFAIFFPAVTGILSGLSMSGELKKPERNIPIGILSAIGITFVIYLIMAFRFAYIALPGELAANTSIIIDASKWRFLVIAGIMGATISSALSMFVASPRTLLALSKHKTVPLSSYFSQINKKSEPATAILFTALIALTTIALGSLNKVASLLTMFFLITYGMLNFSVFAEQIMGIPSFRPAFRVSLLFPFLGGTGCFFAMFLINPVFSTISILIIIAIYILLIHKQVQRNWPDVRKGLFIYIAEQAIKIASNLPYHPKIWKPNLLIPVAEPKEWSGIIDFMRAITFPSGRIILFRVAHSKGHASPQKHKDDLPSAELEKQSYDQLKLLTEPLKEEGIIASSITLDSENFLGASITVAQTLRGSLLPPNVFFVKLGLTPKRDETITKLIEKMESLDLGIIMLLVDPKLGFGQKQTINIWIREGSPNIHLAVLIALQLEKNWDAKICLIQVTENKNDEEKARHYLSKLIKIMRIPTDARILVLFGDFQKTLAQAPLADINIFGMPEEVDLSEKRAIAQKINTSVIFLRDSQQESALA